ncbi:hypothetical protein POF50_030035 [Streptomyces sp. SL13]|uniref:Uncharacterized protein n=1 Tax=Streptantibioticus silvisoli TaxID=2705255 RepID=A0AA90HBQ3_9ACTN|nr:hypothetical protein [Streptantibioticus silvisoli]MDI5973532.1 hypothetical protein [Streptantibioticus silvisoli]
MRAFALAFVAGAPADCQLTEPVVVPDPVASLSSTHARIVLLKQRLTDVAGGA